MKLIFLTLFCLFTVNAFASGGGELTHQLTNLVMQLGVILIVARVFGNLFEKIKLPSVLGEVFAGILIGPYLLGSIPFLGFTGGFFPTIEGSSLSISPELYGIATIASIILLFTSGLETDIDLLLRYFGVGFIVAVGGLIFSFVAGAAVGVVFLNLPILHPKTLFLGAMATATSVGISARLLTQENKMASAEGVCIISAAVIDDVIGIILLAVVVGFSSLSQGGASGVQWLSIGILATKAITIWLLITSFGIIFARKISSILKLFGSKNVFAIIALSLAFIVASIFEKAGLAMIIGAYIIGLSLSKTDINFTLLETLEPLKTFFVPIFFAVMGMMVDVRIFSNIYVIGFSIAYSIVGILAKIAGGYIPARFLNFNNLGSLRIGLGMAPRGEVVMIIAGFGLAHKVIDETIFASAVMLVLLSAVLVSPLLAKALQNKKSGTTKPDKSKKSEITKYSFENEEFTEMMIKYILDYFQGEGFFVNRLNIGTTVYQIRKESMDIKMSIFEGRIEMATKSENTFLVKSIVYEAIIKLAQVVKLAEKLSNPKSLRDEIAKSAIKTASTKQINLKTLVDIEAISLNLQSNQKEQIIAELVELIEGDKNHLDREKIKDDVIKRERIISTAFTRGIAIPHAKSSGVSDSKIAIGISRKGVDFNSMDELPTKIFALLVSSKKGESKHIQTMAKLSQILQDQNNIDKILNSRTKKEIYEIFTGHKRRKN